MKNSELSLEDWIFLLVRDGKKKEAKKLATEMMRKGTALTENFIKVTVKRWIEEAEERVEKEASHD